MQHIIKSVLAILALLATSSTAQAETVIFDHLRILTMTDSGPIENGHVIIRDGQIETVATGRAPSIDGAVVIDGTDRTLMPGLHDMHVHYYDRDDGLLFLANGITTVRNLTGTGLQFRFDEAARTGALAGPRVVTSGAILDGPGSFLRDSALIVETPEQAIGAVRAQHAAGFRAVKLYEFLTVETYQAAAAEARRLDMNIYTHTPAVMNVGDVLAVGVDSIEHFDGYGPALVREDFVPANARFPWAEQWSNIDESRVSEWARQTAMSETTNVPTLVLHIGQLSAEDPDAFFETPAAAFVEPQQQQAWRGFDGWLRQFFPFTRTQYQGKIAFARALRAQGAPLLIGTDTPNPFIIPGFSIHDELAAFSEIGFSNEEILHKATFEAADFLGRSDISGVIAPGAEANLVLLDGDPRENLEYLRRPAGVMVSGHWRDRAMLDRLLAERRTDIEAMEQPAE